MALRRLDLPDGQWADLRERPTNAQFLAISNSPANDYQVVGRQLTTAWYVRGEDGQPLPFDDTGWGLADAGLVLDICVKASEIFKAWSEERRPKAMTSTSSDGGSEDEASR